MSYIHYQIKALPYNTVVVSLTEKATVRLFDELNYHKYKGGRSAQATQQYLETPSLNIQVPYKGKWHIVIEKGNCNKNLLKTIVSIV
jgi:hypothetical protein